MVCYLTEVHFIGKKVINHGFENVHIFSTTLKTLREKWIIFYQNNSDVQVSLLVKTFIYILSPDVYFI